MNKQSTIKNKLVHFFRIFLRIILWIVGCVLILLLLISLAFFVPPVQNFVVQKVVNSIQPTIGTEVSLEKVRFHFPNSVYLEGLYLEDQSQDTLAYIGELDISVDYFALLHKEFEIGSLELSNSNVELRVNEEGVFNFQYMIDSLAADTASPPPADTSSAAPFTFDIGNVTLKNVKFSYHSVADGMEMQYKVGRLALSVDQLDLKEQIYLADYIELENTYGEFIITKAVPDTSEATPMPQMLVGAKSLELNNTAFLFEDQTTQLVMDSKVGSLSLTAEPIQLADAKVKLNEMMLENSHVYLEMNSEAGTADSLATGSGNTTDSVPVPVWIVESGQVDIRDFHFKFRDQGVKTTANGFDPANMDIQVTELEVEDQYFAGMDSISGEINTLQVSTADGFTVEDLQLEFKMSEQLLVVQNLLLETEESTIRSDVKLAFNSLEGIANELDQLQATASFDGTRIAWSDVAYLVPQLQQMKELKNYRGLQLYADGKLAYEDGNARVDDLKIRTRKHTSLTIDGDIMNVLQADKASFSDVRIGLKSTAGELNRLLPDSLIPPNIQLPAEMALNARINGSVSDLKADLQLNSSMGNFATRRILPCPLPMRQILTWKIFTWGNY